MNQLIKQLEPQCWEHNEFGLNFNYEKFAELIVKECADACLREGKTYEVESAGEYQSNLYATAIKKHFGVEE